MKTVAICENVWKKYRLSASQYYHLRDDLSRAVRKLFSPPARLLTRLLPVGRRPVGKDLSQHSIRDEFWALQGVSLEVEAGEALGILGPNGAGKSTILKLLARITYPTTGRIEVNGKVTSLIEVGAGFHSELTGRENIYLYGSVIGMKRGEIEAKFESIVEFAELEQFIDVPLKKYSSGMHVRLGFAVATHADPQLLLIDEALAVGDIFFQHRCLRKIKKMLEDEVAVIFVSHNTEMVKTICHRALLLDQGRVVELGDPVMVASTYHALASRKEEAEIQQRGLENVLPLTKSLELTGNGQDLLEDIPDYKRALTIKSGYLRIMRVSFLNSKGQKTQTLYFQEPFEVKLVFEVLQLVEEVRIGTDICTPGGTRISVTHHTDGGLKPLALDRGWYSISVRIENRLVPGNYVLSVGAHDLKTTLGLDWVPRALDFTVVGFSEEGIYLHDDYNAGFTYVPAQWAEVTSYAPP